MHKSTKSPDRQTAHGVRHRLARFIKPAPVSAGQMLLTGLVAGLAILIAGYASERILDNPGKPFLLASMGASAVILFAVPQSPMARPWAVLGGHLLSGAIGVTCAHTFTDIPIAAAMAAGLSILVMSLARCLHPPGGATALLAVLGGDSVRSLDYQFLLIPALNLIALLVMARWFSRRATPAPVAVRPHVSPSDPPPTERVGIRQEDWEAALQAFKTWTDVSENELKALYQLAASHAHQRQFGQRLCSDIMSRALITAEFASELEEVWQQMQQENIRAVPVVDRARHVIGIVTRTDFLRHAGIENYPGLHGQLARLIRRTPGMTSSKPEVAGQIMSAPVITAYADEPVANLIPLLSERGIHQVPILDRRNQLVGLITQSDLIGLFHSGQNQG